MNSAVTYLGLDIAKLTLELSPIQGTKTHPFTNDSKGHQRLVAHLKALPGDLHIVCEATGGYEHDLLKALFENNVAVSLVNPRKIRDFARARGILAKTDRIDALVLASYGRLLTPPRTLPKPAEEQRLTQLVTRRQELMGLIGQEQNRQEHHHDPFVVKQAKSLIKSLKRHVQLIEAELATLQESSTSIALRVERLSSIQGIAQRTSWILLAALPELGTLDRGQAAALAGLAPYNHDSGPLRGKRHIAHGRPLARSALYMAALTASRHNPVLSPIYKHLRAAGKPAKVALTALMRRLAELANLILKNPKLKLLGSVEQPQKGKASGITGAKAALESLSKAGSEPAVRSEDRALQGCNPSAG